jgi:hypothetical protein
MILWVLVGVFVLTIFFFLLRHYKSYPQGDFDSRLVFCYYKDTKEKKCVNKFS